METNNTGQGRFTKSDVELFLLEEFKLPDAHSLFSIRETDPETYHEIADAVFLKFTNHRTDRQSGELVTEDPNNPLIRFFVFGYPGYHTIRDMDDLLDHMHNACELRSGKLSSLEATIENGQADSAL